MAGLPPDPAAVRSELERILKSPPFAHSERLRRFLTFVVDGALAGRADGLKESVIGVEVFDRPPGDSRDETIVRVEARRLRAKLAEFYAGDGGAGAVRIELPKGGYVPAFVAPATAATAQEASPAPQPNLPLADRTRQPWALVSAILAGTLFVLGVWWWRTRPAEDVAPWLSLRQLTADSGLTSFPALSRDGKLVAYASDRATQKNLDLWVQPLTEGGQPIRVTTDEADDFDPDFSPAGGLIAFQSSRDGGGIYVVPALGGEPRLLVRAGQRPRFSPDGKSVAYCVGCAFLEESRIFSIPVTGGVPIPIATDVPWASVPVFSDDGRHVLFEGAPAVNDLANHDWWVAPVQGGPSVKTGAFARFREQGLVPEYGSWKPDWAGDRVRFIDRAHVWEMALSKDDWKPAGPARRVTFGTGLAVTTRSAGSRMVFDQRHHFSHLWKLKLDWNQAKALGEPELVAHAGGSQQRPSASRDGTLLAYSQEEPGGDSIRVRSLADGRETTLVSVTARPKVSPDGSRVGYSISPGAFYLIPAGGGEAELLMRTTGSPGSIYGWTPDGTRIVYWTGRPPSWFLLDPTTRWSTPLLSHPRGSVVQNTVVSPDQRWLAFRIPAGRHNPLWIAPLRDLKAAEERDWIPVGDDSGPVGAVFWSPDSNLLYVMSQSDGHLCLWAQRLDPPTKRPLGERFPVHHIHTARLAIPDTNFFGPAVLPDGVIFAAREQTGNVWLAEQ